MMGLKARAIAMRGWFPRALRQAPIQRAMPAPLKAPNTMFDAYRRRGEEIAFLRRRVEVWRQAAIVGWIGLAFAFVAMVAR